jgi:hypothetical protein
MYVDKWKIKPGNETEFRVIVQRREKEVREKWMRKTREADEKVDILYIRMKGSRKGSWK